jgi:putative PIN family toxin of toxin-antitoxin system
MLPQSVPGHILQAWNDNQLDLVLSKPILNEISTVLAYAKIQKRLGWSKAVIRLYVGLLTLKADLVITESVSVRVPADPQDNPILATLIASNADYLVTGDKGLLALKEKYPIVTPAEFVKML